MKFKEFNIANVRRCEESFHPVRSWSATDWATALAGEAGELCNLIKKLRRGEDIDINEIGKEMGDIVAYLDLLATYFHLDLGEITKNKFNEVSDRVGSEIKL